MWTTIPGTTNIMKRGDLGFSTDKEQTIDILKTADSLFTNVEKEFPKCQSQTDDYRKQAWGPYINKVGPLINANNIDSASKLLDQALVIYRGSPFSYYFKGQIEYREERFRRREQVVRARGDAGDADPVARTRTTPASRSTAASSRATLRRRRQ